MKPIETEYNGLRFRSRQEARTAIFLDALQIPYLYEPEGLELSDGTRYLPDFYLTDSKQFLEVKGILSEYDEHKIKQAIAEGIDVVTLFEDFSFTACWLREDGNGTDRKDNSYLCKCLHCGKYWFNGESGDWKCRCCGASDGNGHFYEAIGGLPEYNSDDDREYYAVQLARQARFEHGETPTKEDVKRKMEEW